MAVSGKQSKTSAVCRGVNRNGFCALPLSPQLTTKISLPVLAEKKQQPDFLPLVVVSAVLVFSFLVGQKAGGFLWPQFPDLSARLSTISTVGLATVSQSLPRSLERVNLDLDLKISSPLPSLNQSWNELEASVFISLSQLGKFGHQLWEFTADQLASSIDWLAESAGQSQKGLVYFVDQSKTWLVYSVDQGRDIVWQRLTSSLLQIKSLLTFNLGKKVFSQTFSLFDFSFLAKLSMPDFSLPSAVVPKEKMVATISSLDKFDQRSTLFLAQVFTGLGEGASKFNRKIYLASEKAWSVVYDLPQQIIHLAPILFFQPLVDLTTRFTAGEVALVGQVATENVEPVVVSSEKQISSSFSLTSISSLAVDFLIKVKTAVIDFWQKVGHLIGQPIKKIQNTVQLQPDQSYVLATIKFLGVYDTSVEIFQVIVDRLKAFGHWSIGFVQGLWQAVVKNWGQFLGLNNDDERDLKKATQATAINADQVKLLEEKITNRLRNDLRQEFSEVVQKTSANNLSQGGVEGLIVAPSSGKAEDDQKLKTKIQEMFSDRINVDFDASRKAGVISPVFNPNENYIFLLTPIKK